MACGQQLASGQVTAATGTHTSGIPGHTQTHLLELLLCELLVTIAALLEDLNPERGIVDKLGVVVFCSLVFVLPLVARLLARQVLLLIFKS